MSVYFASLGRRVKGNESHYKGIRVYREGEGAFSGTLEERAEIEAEM